MILSILEHRGDPSLDLISRRRKHCLLDGVDVLVHVGFHASETAFAVLVRAELIGRQHVEGDHRHKLTVAVFLASADLHLRSIRCVLNNLAIGLQLIPKHVESGHATTISNGAFLDFIVESVQELVYCADKCCEDTRNTA